MAHILLCIKYVPCLGRVLSHPFTFVSPPFAFWPLYKVGNGMLDGMLESLSSSSSWLAKP